MFRKKFYISALVIFFSYVFMLLQLSKQYTVWTNDFIKIHLINHNPQQVFILHFCLHGYDIEYSDRRLPEFELNICPLFLLENVCTVHHKTHILQSHLQLGIPSTMVLTQCIFLYSNIQLNHTTTKNLEKTLYTKSKTQARPTDIQTSSWCSTNIANQMFILIV